MSLLPNLDQMTDDEKLAVLESIQKSIAQSKEIQKRKIGENVDLVVQALKKIESDIRDRFDSVGNSIEKRVLSIKDGLNGSNGKDGRDGKDGKSGKDGLKGDKGERGQDGRDGVDGIDGVSVVNANIDFDGSLVISLSDGREINVGEVVSADVAEKIKVISTMSTNGAVGIKDEGTSISTGVKTINFVGAAVTATNSGDDVTVNVSSGTGTVTSVAATAGTGISVSGSPITTSGTLTITNTAPDQTVALTQGGTTTITGTYPNFTISSADQFSGTVTSVAATVPAFLSVAGSPVTTSGTLAIGLSGTALPVANGGTGVTTSTGTTNVVLSNSPTLVTPALGTPSALVGTNITGTATAFNINGTVGATTPAAGTFTSLSDSGNLTFTGTGNRITGDFSNATLANRVAFQNSTANSATAVGLLPNGTSTQSQLVVYNNSDPTNANGTQILVNATESRLQATNNGTAGNLPMTFYTGGSERARIDTSGNVGIGTSSPDSTLRIDSTNGSRVRFGFTTGGLDYGIYQSDQGGVDANYFSNNVGIGTSSPAVKLDVNGITGWGGSTTGIVSSLTGANASHGNGGNLRVLTSTTQAADVGGSMTFGGYYIGTSNSIDLAEIAGRKENSTSGNTAGYLQFGTRANAGNITERMRIDSSGNLLVGGTAQRNLAKQSIEYTSGNNGLAIYCVANASATDFVTFTANAGTVCGVISRVGTTAAVVYTATSDYRLKENITPMTGALNKIAQLKPVTYTWKNGGEAAEGFIAHELQEVCPDAVVGTKDEIDADGNPKYQAVDQSKIVALLTAAMQEQQTLIQSLTARITALETN